MAQQATMLVAPALERGNATKLLMMHAIQPNPLLTPFLDRVAQLGRITVETNGVRVQGVDLHSSLEELDQNLRGHLRHPDALRHRPIDEIHADAVELVASFSVDGGLLDRFEFEEAWSSCDCTARHDERSRNEDGVEEVVSDLAVRLETIDGADGVGIVGVKRVKEERDRGVDVGVKSVLCLFLGGKSISILGEFV